jgi:hypothetical protein
LSHENFVRDLNYMQANGMAVGEVNVTGEVNRFPVQVLSCEKVPVASKNCDKLFILL